MELGDIRRSKDAISYNSRTVSPERSIPVTVRVCGILVLFFNVLRSRNRQAYNRKAMQTESYITKSIRRQVPSRSRTSWDSTNRRFSSADRKVDTIEPRCCVLIFFRSIMSGSSARTSITLRKFFRPDWIAVLRSTFAALPALPGRA